jgi:flagellar biosynthesis/type III secretory pathway chaperone
METLPHDRQPVIDELNQLTERKWDLMEELAELEVARAALFNQLRGHDNGNL